MAPHNALDCDSVKVVSVPIGPGRVGQIKDVQGSKRHGRAEIHLMMYSNRTASFGPASGVQPTQDVSYATASVIVKLAGESLDKKARR